jgi:hypothetical protein
MTVADTQSIVVRRIDEPTLWHTLENGCLDKSRHTWTTLMPSESGSRERATTLA